MAGTGRMSPKEFAARLEVLCSDAQGEVREAARRLVRSVRKEESPGRSDLALVLLHVVGELASPQVLEAPPQAAPVAGPPARRQEPIGRPSRSPFADRIREQEQDQGPPQEVDLEVQRRFGVASDDHGRRRRRKEE